MISTLLRVHWLTLKRDRVALGLTFLLPLVFFSIFGMIFGGMSGPGAGSSGGSGPARIRVLAIDLDGSEVSRRLLSALGRQDGIELALRPDADRETVRSAVRAGDAPAAVVIPAGFSERFGDFVERPDPVEVLYDRANPMAKPAVEGLLQAAAMQASPDLMLERGFDWLGRAGSGLTPEQRELVEQTQAYLRMESTGGESGEGGSFAGGLIDVHSTDVREAKTEVAPRRRYPMIAYNAAGIGVMFLLFSMAGVGGSLLDDQDRGVLERLLVSPVGIGRILLGHWIFAFFVGVVQVAVMFLWGAAVFDLELFTPNRLAGFGLMTVATAASAAAFGMVLATLCKTRAQLSGVSTIVILVMSAMGGSMVPRFMMPRFMETTALLTFNGWALDGFLKVFWYDDPSATLGQAVANLWPQLAALSAAALAFYAAARVLARRWETV